MKYINLWSNCCWIICPCLSAECIASFTALALTLLPGIHRWRELLVLAFMAYEQSALLLRKQLAGKNMLNMVELFFLRKLATKYRNLTTSPVLCIDCLLPTWPCRLTSFIFKIINSIFDNLLKIHVILAFKFNNLKFVSIIPNCFWFNYMKVYV